MNNPGRFSKIAIALTVIILLQSVITMHYSFADDKQSLIPSGSENKGVEDSSIFNQSMKNTELNEEQMDKELKESAQKFSTQSKEIEKGKGKFYEAYEKEIDKLIKQEEKLNGKGSADLYSERLESLDYQKGTIECGKFDVICNIDSVMFHISKSAISYALSPLSKLAIKPSEILEDSVLTRFKDGFGTLPQALLSLILIYQILKMLVVRFTDMSDAPALLNEKLVKTVMAAFLLFAYTPFFKLLLDLQYALNAPIFYQLTGSSTLQTDITIAFLMAPNGAMMFVFMLIYALVVLALFLQMVYSFCLISVLFVVGPIAVVTIPNDEYNFFSLWLKTYASRALTMFIQGLCVVLSISFLTNFDNIFNLSKQPFIFASAIGFLIVGIMAPSILQAFGSSSGSGRMIISTIKTVARRR